jgi:hypothetical protein
VIIANREPACLVGQYIKLIAEFKERCQQRRHVAVRDILGMDIQFVE